MDVSKQAILIAVSLLLAYAQAGPLGDSYIEENGLEEQNGEMNIFRSARSQNNGGVSNVIPEPHVADEESTDDTSKDQGTEDDSNEDSNEDSKEDLSPTRNGRSPGNNRLKQPRNYNKIKRAAHFGYGNHPSRRGEFAAVAGSQNFGGPHPYMSWGPALPAAHFGHGPQAVSAFAGPISPKAYFPAGTNGATAYSGPKGSGLQQKFGGPHPYGNWGLSQQAAHVGNGPQAVSGYGGPIGAKAYFPGGMNGATPYSGPKETGLKEDYGGPISAKAYFPSGMNGATAYSGPKESVPKQNAGGQVSSKDNFPGRISVATAYSGPQDSDSKNWNKEGKYYTGTNQLASPDELFEGSEQHIFLDNKGI